MKASTQEPTCPGSQSPFDDRSQRRKENQILHGRVAVVTGGGSGIGEAIAWDLSARGAALVIADVSPRGESVAEDISANGNPAVFIRTDVTDESSVASLMQMTVQRFGHLDVLVANAGVPEQKSPVHKMDLAAWQRVIDIDLTGVVLTNKHAAARMLENGGGSVVNIASILGHVGQANSTAYSAAKAGVVNFTRSAALTYAQQNIRFNCVAPGYVDTPLLAELPEETRSQMIAKTPIGRLARPEEIARVVAFLASDDSSIITGASINADGGYTAS
jgi:NAD(P)-dependent dehydrogenase (short-subunit alcohol dehydrogenase family)